MEKEPHKNDMSAWDSISCQRSHATHDSRRVTIDLSNQHGYHDLPQIPSILRRRFDMMIWDPEAYPVDGGPYCPAHDAVSETIVSHRTWEPTETILTLLACSRADPAHTFVDLGAQMGWFSLLAASCGLRVYSFDADPECISLLTSSASLNGWQDRIVPTHLRLTSDTLPLDLQLSPSPPSHIAMAKVDLEGAEDAGIDFLFPYIRAGQLDYLLLEVSPVFADYYPSLVSRILDQGYWAYHLPPKRRPPISITSTADLAPFRLTSSSDIDPHQENIFFIREELKA